MTSTEHDQQTPLRNINFGRIDAEADDQLMEYFIQTGTSEEIELGKYLILGRKGSGKTALFKHLASTHESRAIQLDLEDYKFDAHKPLIEKGVAPSVAYTASWRLVIAAAILVRASKDLPSKDRKRAESLAQKLRFGSNGDALGQIVDWLGRVRKVDFPSIQGIFDLGGFEVASQENTVSDETLSALGDLEEILIRNWPLHNSLVLIDRLDDAMDGSEESLKLIAGAVRTARHYSSKLPSETTAPVVVFLRSDIWEAISYNDKNKTSQDTIHLDWTTDQLSEVVEERIHASAGTPRGSGWSSFFPQEEMRQRQSAKNYMIKRTLGRPRDIIAFAIFAQEIALTNGHTRIAADDIYNAEGRYSCHLIDELSDEISPQVGDFRQVVNAIKGLQRRTFTQDDWRKSAEAVGLSNTESQKILELLFEASAIGVYVKGGAQGGSSTQFRYQDRFLQPAPNGTLQVHPGMIRELKLTDR